MNRKKNFSFEHLSNEEFKVLRESATEAPWSGEYNDYWEEGFYKCKGCEQNLFKSNNKFDSGCGWPSFDYAIKGSVIEKEDLSLGMRRIEVICSKCKSHLGHVFNDGPKETTGMRYCMNSISLNFKK